MVRSVDSYVLGTDGDGDGDGDGMACRDRSFPSRLSLLVPHRCKRRRAAVEEIGRTEVWIKTRVKREMRCDQQGL